MSFGYYLIPVSMLVGWSVYHFAFSPVHVEKMALIEEIITRGHPLLENTLHERAGIERILLQKEGTKRLVYHIEYPSSEVDFNPQHQPTLERVSHFEIWHEDGPQKRIFRGDKALYDFKKQTLFADDFHLSIYNTNIPVFDGIGKNFSFYFHELGPCFSGKNFTAHINMEDS